MLVSAQSPDAFTVAHVAPVMPMAMCSAPAVASLHVLEVLEALLALLPLAAAAHVAQHSPAEMFFMVACVHQPMFLSSAQLEAA